MPRLAPLAAILLPVSLFSFADDKPTGPTLAGKNTPLKPMVTGLKHPTAVAVGLDGKVYVTLVGELDKAGAGSVVLIQDGKAKPVATGLDAPNGIVAFQQFL
ncbi:MAG: hypothetical protein U0797_31540, partial [Gemmataceae bacterium]